jgi:hypothetical protein
MSGMDKSPLFSRLHELRAHQGKGWKEIANILEEEGYEENGKALTDNALRKRYAKRNKTDTQGTSPVASEPEPKQEGGEFDLDWLQKGRMDSELKRFEEAAALPAAPENAIATGIASLVSLNNRLLEQIQQFHRILERLEKRFDEQEQKKPHTGMDMEEPVTSRDLFELLKEFGRMRFIEENKEYEMSREEVQQLIEESVEEKVESELRAMLSPEGSFSRELGHLVDHRLKTLFTVGEPVADTPQAGPGRGKRGRTHKKFSASLEKDLFDRVKSLPGKFSGHLANALSTYVSLMEEKQG